MQFLSVGSHVCHRASFGQFLVDLPLPLASDCRLVERICASWVKMKSLPSHNHCAEERCRYVHTACVPVDQLTRILRLCSLFWPGAKVPAIKKIDK